jgi:hypothetical protein
VPLGAPLRAAAMIVAPPPTAAVAPPEGSALPRAQEMPTPGACLGPSLEALASAVHKYRAAGPSSADAPSSTTPPSNEPATSDALPGSSTREAQAPIQEAQVPPLAAAPAACTAAAGPVAGNLMLPSPSFGSASAVASSHFKDSSLSEYEMVRVRR